MTRDEKLRRTIKTLDSLKRTFAADPEAVALVRLAFELATLIAKADREAMTPTRMLALLGQPPKGKRPKRHRPKSGADADDRNFGSALTH